MGKGQTTKVTWDNFWVDGSKLIEAFTKNSEFVCIVKWNVIFLQNKIYHTGIILFHTHFPDNKVGWKITWNILCVKFKKQSHGFATKSHLNYFHWLYFKCLISTRVWRKTFPALLFFMLCQILLPCVCMCVCFKTTLFS